MKRNDYGMFSNGCTYAVYPLTEFHYSAVQLLIKEEIDEYFRWPSKYEILLESEFTAKYLCIKYPDIFKLEI